MNLDIMEWLKKMWCRYTHIEHWRTIEFYSNWTHKYKCRKCGRTQFD